MTQIRFILDIQEKHELEVNPFLVDNNNLLKTDFRNTPFKTLLRVTPQGENVENGDSKVPDLQGNVG